MVSFMMYLDVKQTGCMDELDIGLLEMRGVQEDSYVMKVEVISIMEKKTKEKR